MDRTERFHRIDRLLRRPGGVSSAQLRDALEVSNSTLKRDLEYLRDRLGAPIVWHRDSGRYAYAEGTAFALPGLWLTAAELEALLTLDRLLEQLHPDLLGEALKPLRDRLLQLIAEQLPRGARLAERVRLLGSAQARQAPACFPMFAQATLERRRLWIRHHHRERNEWLTRELSPQRLTRYRDNWYCEAWCHWRGALRRFALDAVTEARVLPRSADEIPLHKIDAVLGAGYGIFRGRRRRLARLRFSAQAARWVAHEQWHPQARGRWLSDGRYELCVPYTDERELLMDLLRHGPEVEVLGPPDLRAALIGRLDAARAQYGAATAGSSGEPVLGHTPDLRRVKRRYRT